MSNRKSITNLVAGSALLLGASSAFAADNNNTTCQDAGTYCDEVSHETIDLLALYDQDTVDYYGSEKFVTTMLKGWEEDVNSFYANSGVGLKLRIVGKEFYNSSARTPSDLLTEIRGSRYVDERRNAIGADFVTLIQNVPAYDGRFKTCGVGYTSVHKSAAYSVVGADCGSLTLAHEMGHNMGLLHSRQQGDTSGTRYAYGLGHGIMGRFSTIMAYPQSYNTRNQIGVFSNPNLKCSGYACGVPAQYPNSANAVLAINNVRQEVSEFNPTKTYY